MFDNTLTSEAKELWPVMDNKYTIFLRFNKITEIVCLLIFVLNIFFEWIAALNIYSKF